MTDVFVVCPANSQSGGPELCHQLVHTLNCAEPGRAAILYNPFELKHKTPPSYSRYNTPPAMIDDIGEGATVVLPETYGSVLNRFVGTRTVFWWMSVNNFHVAAGGAAAAQMEALRQHVELHLYQSEYARSFLHTAHLGPAARLSDYLASDYIRAIGGARPRHRRELVAFNPAKGIKRTGLIFHALAKGVKEAPKVVALEGMSRDQIRQVLAEAKVYIDFGEHPGKDRMPREAAAMGCCVLTNRRGAAGNNIDVPIPADCKIDDRKPRFELRAVGKIHKLLDDFHQQSPRFDDYRRTIASEPVLFEADAEAVFSRQLAH